MGCRDGDTVCIDIGETRGDGVWKKRISVETGVGGCDSIAACMDVGVNVETLWTQEHIWRDIRICRERLAGLYHTLER